MPLTFGTSIFKGSFPFPINPRNRFKCWVLNNITTSQLTLFSSFYRLWCIFVDTSFMSQHHHQWKHCCMLCKLRSNRGLWDFCNHRLQQRYQQHQRLAGGHPKSVWWCECFECFALSECHIHCVLSVLGFKNTLLMCLAGCCELRLHEALARYCVQHKRLQLRSSSVSLCHEGLCFSF